MIEIADIVERSGESMTDSAKVKTVRGCQNDEPYDKNSWGTPEYILDAVREAFGGQIDCDPASNAKAQERVRATWWCGPDAPEDQVTWSRDGNDYMWSGNVWLNPPYGKGLIDPFASTLESGWHHGTIKAHAVLTNLDTSTRWFRSFSALSDHIVLLRDRVKFIHPITQEPVKDQQRCQILFVRNVNLEPLRKLGSVYARSL